MPAHQKNMIKKYLISVFPKRYLISVFPKKYLISVFPTTVLLSRPDFVLTGAPAPGRPKAIEVSWGGRAADDDHGGGDQLELLLQVAQMSDSYPDHFVEDYMEVQLKVAGHGWQVGGGEGRGTMVHRKWWLSHTSYLSPAPPAVPVSTFWVGVKKSWINAKNVYFNATSTTTVLPHHHHNHLHHRHHHHYSQNMTTFYHHEHHQNTWIWPVFLLSIYAVLLRNQLCRILHVFGVKFFSWSAGGKKDKYEVWQCTMCEVTPVISALGCVTRPIQWSVNKAIKSVEWWGWLDQGTNCASYAAAAHEPKLWCPTLGSFFNSSK